MTAYKRRAAKAWYRVASLITVVVVLLVGAMMRVEVPTPEWWDVSGLPLFHAVLNSIAAVCILLGGLFIKAGRKTAHRNMMMTAFTVSGIFLVSYVVYHMTSGHTLFGDLDHNGVLSEGEKQLVATRKPVYLAILLTHILLAIISFPLILFAVIAAFFQQFSRHKKLVRWAYPLWLYVAVTGPVVYALISPYYP